MTESLRLRITIKGVVQGVGFRPFIYRLAREMELKGWVNNSAQGVMIEVEGKEPQLEKFIVRMNQEKPAHSFIQSFQSVYLDSIGYTEFQIQESDASSEKVALVMPDIATCPECLKEIFDSHNRRYLYPFTNCTHCGPRYSIIEDLPYDRCHTSMKNFTMCPSCQKEYDDPLDRRFHAQPNACGECGPHVEIWDEEGNILCAHHAAIVKAAEAIKTGRIVAVKGLGGFHLMADARNEKAVARLRERKHREEKPLALLFPSLKAVEEVCLVSDLEKYLLGSSESPIVLLPKKESWLIGLFQNKNVEVANINTFSSLGKRPNIDFHNVFNEEKVNKRYPIAPSVAPGNPGLGGMLPYTPLHYILMRELSFPVVATSGNISDEPICTDEQQALSTLQGIADLFLIHNRPIVRHVDDSVVRMMMQRPLVLRRARGYAPLPVHLKEEFPTVLAVGGHLKNTVALSVKDNIFISQHIGDLETKKSFDTFKTTIESLTKLYDTRISRVACDMHPEYISTQQAHLIDKPMTRVQHHHAHIVSCMAENELQGKVLGVSWDGTGYGTDNTIWGGEFLLSTLTDFERIGHLRTFRLPGGEVAIKEPRRTAFGLLYEMYKEKVTDLKDLPCLQAFCADEFFIIQRMIDKKFNSPKTSSAGRLFDAVASLIGLRQSVSFEGQAAMALEHVMNHAKTSEWYNFELIDKPPGGFIVDWSKIIEEVIRDVRAGIALGMISARFHNALVEVIVDTARRAKEKRVVLSGGCFQNKYLTERAIVRLRAEGFQVYWHQSVPPNDGGIALGQLVSTAYRLKNDQSRVMYHI